MTRDEFEAEPRREGYEVRDGSIKSDEHRPAHSHPFDVRVPVLDGSIAFVFGDDRLLSGPRQCCNVPAGTMHEERTEADGARFVAGRRAVAAAAAPG